MSYFGYQSLLEVVLKNTASIATALRQRLATKSDEVSALYRRENLLSIKEIMTNILNRSVRIEV